MLLSIMVFAGLVFTAVRYEHLPVGRALHRALIAEPASWLMRIPPRRIAIILLLLICAALVWIEIGPLLMATDYAPLLWFADMSLYLDALLMVAVAFAAVQVRSISRLTVAVLRGAVAANLVRPRTRARSYRPRRPKPQPPANDDVPGVASRISA